MSATDNALHPNGFFDKSSVISRKFVLNEMKQSSVNGSQTLRSLMQSAGIPSYRSLAERAAVSRWQVQQLRSGKIAQMRIAILARLAAALEVSLETLLGKFGLTDEFAEATEPDPQAPQLTALQQEYQRLKSQIAQQTTDVQQQVQTAALQTLESWLVQWPTVAKRAAERPDLPAAKVIPLVRPVEQLMAEWAVEAIAPVDAEVPYDPQQHQLTGGSAEPGMPVRATHSGQRYRGKLLHRAKVKPIGR